MANGIRSFRERRGLTKSELARRVDTTRAQMGRLEKGDRKLTTEWAARIAPHLGCTAQELLFPTLSTDRTTASETSSDQLGPTDRSYMGPTTFDVAASRFARDSSPFLSAERVAKVLGLNLSELQSLINVPVASRAQRDERAVDAALSSLVRIIVAASSMAGSDDRAAIWFKHQAIPGWTGKTAHDLVGEGKADKVLAYLEAVRSGSYT